MEHIKEFYCEGNFTNTKIKLKKYYYIIKLLNVIVSKLKLALGFYCKYKRSVIKCLS